MGGYTARTQSNSIQHINSVSQPQLGRERRTTHRLRYVWTSFPNEEGRDIECRKTDYAKAHAWHCAQTEHCSLLTNFCTGSVHRQWPAHSLKTLSLNLFSTARAQLLPALQVCHKANQSESSDKPIREQEKVNSHWLSLLLSTRRWQKVGFYESSINMGFPMPMFRDQWSWCHVVGGVFGAFLIKYNHLISMKNKMAELFWIIFQIRKIIKK